MTKVVHCRKQQFDVYIGRPSLWGNPFHISPTCSRLQAVARYHAWILTQPALLAQVHTLRGKVLGCWCAPQLCHGSVLAQLAEMPAWEISILIAKAAHPNIKGFARP